MRYKYGSDRWLFCVCVWLACINTASAAESVQTKIAGKEVFVWEPPASSDTEKDTVKYPVVFFSHGMGGCATQSVFLTEAIAERGYWVFAPNHKDAKCVNGKATGAPEQSFRDPGKWTDQTYAARAEDIRSLLGAIKKSEEYGKKVDASRVGLVGHSLGGYTVLGLAGAWPRWTMPDVKAVLALSPYSRPYDLKKTLGNIHVPVMYQGGSFDLAITPFIKRPGGSYDQTPAPKYFAEFSQAGHFAWTNRNGDRHPEIIRYALAFLDTYMKSETKESREVLTTKGPTLDTLRYDVSLPGSDETQQETEVEDESEKRRERFRKRAEEHRKRVMEKPPIQPKRTLISP